ncbi:peptidase inhibitor family I36 protein [Amycolatopsis sp. NPDC058340]|uniref:peptidase inhibitor family I36 protein n=1 Tax=Amycolatopsis sp. NPDC058340 TaxID=3346453 RepID=UPI00364EBD0C
MHKYRLGAAFLAAVVMCLAGGVPANAGQRDEHCVADTATGAFRCFGSAEESLAAASAGEVGASATVISVLYEHANFGGASVAVTGSPCVEGTNQTVGFLGAWNDRISSFKTFNNCYITMYEHAEYQGASQEWYANDSANYGSNMNDLGSSVVYSRGPSRAELLKDCGRATKTCNAHVDQRGQDFYGDWGRVDTVFNCSANKITQVIGKRDTRSGKNTVSNELSVSAGFEFLVQWTVAYKRTWGQEWGWETSESVETRIEVNPGYWAGLDRSPVMRVGYGSYDMWYDKRRWGHHQWYVWNFSGEGPAPGVVGQTRTVGKKMTSEEKKKVCGKSAGLVRSSAVTEAESATTAAKPAAPAVRVAQGALHS